MRMVFQKIICFLYPLTASKLFNEYTYVLFLIIEEIYHTNIQMDQNWLFLVGPLF